MKRIRAIEITEVTESKTRTQPVVIEGMDDIQLFWVKQLEQAIKEGMVTSKNLVVVQALRRLARKINREFGTDL
jgi:hypothetical protein